MNKNIYYLFSVKDKYFTELSFILKEKKQFTQFYGLAYAKTPYLKNPIYQNISYVSKIIKNKGLIDYQFLEQIENTYQVNIAMMIRADRHLMRYSKSRRLFIAQELIKLFIYEIEKYSINFVLSEGVGDLISFFAVIYCEYHDIKFAYQIYAGYDGRSYLTSNINNSPNGFEKKFQKNLNTIKNDPSQYQAIDKELQNYIKNKRKPSYLMDSNVNYKVFRFKDIRVLIQYGISYLRDRNGMHYDKFPLWLPIYRLLRIIAKRKYKKFVSKEGKTLDQLKNSQYFIYPLHFEPEAATLINGRWFNDQRKIIEMISINLPVNTLLVVKEHKPSIGRRNIQFYKELSRFHNVFLIDDTVDTYQLIENSKGVIVISSTMGLEALMLQKPVLAFGERSYMVSSNAFKVDNFRTLNNLIIQVLKHQFDWTDALAYFKTLLMNSKEMGHLSQDDYTKSDLEKLAAEIKEIEEITA